MGLGDIFSSIFGKGKREASSRGRSVETTIRVPFATAAMGGKIPASVPVTSVA
ncbi:MAG: hypothetical protein R2909_13110 [Gemmatimonadales bacterium]